MENKRIPCIVHTYKRLCCPLCVGCWDADRIISFWVLVCTFVFFNNIIQWYFSTPRMTDFLPNFSKLYISAFSILLCFENVPISWLDPLISATVERWMEFLRVGEKCNSISEEIRCDSTWRCGLNIVLGRLLGLGYHRSLASKNCQCI